MKIEEFELTEEELEGVSGGSNIARSLAKALYKWGITDELVDYLDAERIVAEYAAFGVNITLSYEPTPPTMVFIDGKRVSVIEALNYVKSLVSNY